MSPSRRPRSSRGRSRIATGVALLLVVAGCAEESVGPDDGAAPIAAVTDGPPQASAEDTFLVLPPADLLAGPSRDALRTLLQGASTRPGEGAPWDALEPTTSASLADTLALAVRRTGGAGTVCLLGARGRAALTALLAQYPAVRACVVPGPGLLDVPAARVAVGDADLERLGRELGTAARTMAGDGSVLVLDADDVLLDGRWRRGVEEGVLGPAGGPGPSLGIVATAAEALGLLDDQAALLEQGIVPGGPAAVVPGDLLPNAASLRPVAVVVLGTGPDSAELAVALAARGTPVIVPSAFLEAALVAPEQVVAHWRIRWDALLRAALADSTGAEPEPVDRAFVVIDGPAAARS